MFWFAALILIVPFGYVLLFGAPYLPTRRAQVNQALDLLGLKKGDLLVDLGAGDGAVLVVAAERGIRSIGYELNPYVYVVARLRTFKYRHLITIKLQNFWDVPMPTEAKGVFVFLLDKYMPRLDKKLSSELTKGAKLVSYAFEVPHKKVVRQKGALRLYSY